MSIGSESDMGGAYSISPRRIRSKHRSRLISRLAEGEATVSKLAVDSGLRVPHASAEIRRMRGEGLVSSDLPPGSRGSQIRLTEKGWMTLQDDEWSKALTVTELPSNRNDCCILSRDEANLLLCFLSPPSDPMVLIPNRLPPSSGDHPASTRNQGVSWNWAVLTERSPRWFDLGNMEVVEAPPDLADPERIEAYVGQASVVGVMRARMLDEDPSITVSPGAWFSPPRSKPDPPLSELAYHRGPWLLGSCHEMAPVVRPNQPVAAPIKERLPRSVLLRSAKSNAVVVADLGGLHMEGRDYPMSALDHWIQRAHPRLTNHERRRRLQALRDRISTSRRVKTDDSTWRRFRRDWGSASFSTEESSIRLVDLRGLGKSASESLILWSLQEVDGIPLVLEIGVHLPNDVLSLVASHPNLRLVLLDEMMPPFESLDRLGLDRLRTLPWLNFSTKGGKAIPIRLMEGTQAIASSSDDEQYTISPWDILGRTPSHGFTPLKLDGDMASIVGSAASQFPEGDEEWANQMEARYPLAAWVASPQWARWPRWQRLSTRLDPEWLALLDVDHLPIDKISSVADQAPDSVLELYAEKITTKLREDPDNLLRSWPAIDPTQANRGAAWLASQFIQNSAWLPDDSHGDLLGWAVEAWLSEPPRESLSALRGISWLYDNTQSSPKEHEEMIHRIRERGSQLPGGHCLNTWSKLLNHALGEQKADLEAIKQFLRDLPPGWWAPISSEMLMRLLQEDSMDDLLSNRSPWCATILRPIGEECVAPGLSSIAHPGCDPELIQSLQNRMRSISSDDISTGNLDPLSDLLNALESARDKTPPVSGRTHDLVGWLAQPAERWPKFTIEMMMNGDQSVAERLILGLSGFHPGLS